MSSSDSFDWDETAADAESAASATKTPVEQGENDDDLAFHLGVLRSLEDSTPVPGDSLGLITNLFA